MKKINKLTLQKWLPIKEINKEGVVKLKNNKLIKIIKVNPINYNLKSNLEKESILNSYKIFLKTCNFNIQILIQSNKEDLNNHISKIKTNLLKKEKEAFLLPNERVVLNKKNGRMHVEYSTVSNALQWTNGYLFFDEELLPDVVKELERSYNVKIQIASDTLNTFRFYGNFVHREQNIQEVLEALSATRKIHYIIEGHNITLY